MTLRVGARVSHTPRRRRREGRRAARQALEAAGGAPRGGSASSLGPRSSLPPGPAVRSPRPVREPRAGRPPRPHSVTCKRRWERTWRGLASERRGGSGVTADDRARTPAGVGTAWGGALREERGAGPHAGGPSPEPPPPRKHVVLVRAAPSRDGRPWLLVQDFDPSFAPNESFLRTVRLVGFLFIVGTVGLVGDPEKTPMAPGLGGKRVWRPHSHLRSLFFSRAGSGVKGKPAPLPCFLLCSGTWNVLF